MGTLKILGAILSSTSFFLSHRFARQGFFFGLKPIQLLLLSISFQQYEKYIVPFTDQCQTRYLALREGMSCRYMKPTDVCVNIIGGSSCVSHIFTATKGTSAYCLNEWIRRKERNVCEAA